MIITGVDIETTGLEFSEHRIIEIYIGHWSMESRKLVGEYVTRIDPKRSITEKSQRVHGISLADLMGMPDWETVAPIAHRELHRGDFLVAHNGIGFDFEFLDSEFQRVRLPRLAKPKIDTMLQANWATPNGKSPNLGELAFACEVPYDASRAHAADYDVKVMMECFFKGYDWGFFKLEEPLAA